MKSEVFVKGRMAFVSMGYSMLCIGTKEEVDKASPEEIVEMIYHSIAICKYEGLTSKGAVLH